MAGLLGITNDFLIKDISEYVYITFKTFYKKNGSNILICEEFAKSNSLQEIPNECFPEQPNIHFTLSPWIFIYVSIVQPSILGHVSIPLLKIIPIDAESNNKGKFYEFENVEYFSLATESVQIIHFELRDHQGSLIETENGQTLLTLSFKQEK